MSTLLLLLAACAKPTEGVTGSTTPATDDVPAAPAPPDAPSATGGAERGAPQATAREGGPGGGGGGPAAIQTETLYVQNPASGSKIAWYLLTPETGSGPWPTLVIVPGGNHSAEENELFVNRTDSYLGAGFALVMFDPEGRGRSEGKEDLNGPTGQDALDAVIRAAAKDSRVNPKQMGLVSYSFGIALATGVLARHPDVPVKFYIDWEGPVSRDYASGCSRGANPMQSELPFGACDDDSWWKPREAINQIGKVKVPYWRLQFTRDHVQPTWNHTVEIVQAAEKAGVDVRLNEMGKSPKIKTQEDIVPLPNTTPAVYVIADYAVKLMNETAGTSMPPAPTFERPQRPPGAGMGPRRGGGGGPPRPQN